MNFCTILVLILLLQVLRKVQKQTAVVCDEAKISAADYAIRVSNLPTNFSQDVDIDQAIRVLFTECGVPGVRLNVQYVSVCYDYTERRVVEKRLKSEVEYRARLMAMRSMRSNNRLVSDDEIERMNMRIQEDRAQLALINKGFQEGVGVSRKFEGEAYVIFETQRGKPLCFYLSNRV